MEVISLWHGWGGMEAQVSLTVAFSSSAFFDLLFLIFLLTIPHRFSVGFRSGEFAGQSSTPTPWSFNQLLVLLAVWAGAKSCWKMKSASFKSWSAKGSMKCSKIQNVFNIRERRPTDCRGSKGGLFRALNSVGRSHVGTVKGWGGLSPLDPFKKLTTKFFLPTARPFWGLWQAFQP